MMRYISKLRKRFGKIFTFFLFSKPYIVVCEPIVVRRILSDVKLFPKGSDYSNTFSIAFGMGLVTSSGEKHKNDRGIFGKYFIRSNIVKFMNTLNHLTIESIAEFMIDSESSKRYNIEEYFARLSLRCFALFSLNYDFR